MPPASKEELLELQRIDDIASFTRDPLGYVHYAFDWGQGELEGFTGPHQWQAEILDTIGKHLRSAEWATPLRIAVSSGRGIGKSALIALITHWAKDTCDDCRVVVTANTEDQLATKTWPEIIKWGRRAVTAHWWITTATKICSVRKKHADTWRVDRQTWSENNVEAFRGLHNIGKRMVIIFDEAAGIPTPIWEATQGSLTDEGTEMIWLAFSNPSQPSGSFHQCFGEFRHRWTRRQIDSRNVPGTNKEEIKGWVEDYGEDSDYVRINVKGEFPRAGSNQFISDELVNSAYGRLLDPKSYENHWKILVCDVARFGDNLTVIGYRQGPRFVILDKLRGVPVDQVARQVMMRMRECDPRTTVIDGDGIGGGVIDVIRADDWFKGWMAANPARRLTEFHGGIPAKDSFMYFNFRANMWGLMRDWLRIGSIPPDPDLKRELVSPQYTISNKNQITLERKEDMKKRGLASPDIGDTLAMSFCAIVAGKTTEERDREKVEAVTNPADKFLLQYKLTMEKEAMERKAEERGINWE